MLDLAEPVATEAVEVLEAPSAASVMVELQTPVGSFCFTEVVVTTARVEVAGREGWACVLGWDEEGALAAALLDAAPTPSVAQLVAGALSDEAADREAGARAFAATKVGAG